MTGGRWVTWAYCVRGDSILFLFSVVSMLIFDVMIYLLTSTHFSVPLGNTHRLVSCKANTRLTTLHWCGGNVIYRLHHLLSHELAGLYHLFFTVQPCFLSHSMICLKDSAGSSIQKRNWTFWFSYTWSPTLMKGRRKSFSDLNLRSSALIASLSRACCIPQLFFPA